MNRNRWMTGILTIALAILLAGPVRAQEPAGKTDDAAAMMKQMQKIMEMYMVPGPEHKRLEKFVGEWTASMKHWMAPGVPAQESIGTAVNKLILDGRFLYSDNRSEFMGQPFHGIGITGYDRYNKHYVSIWIDSFSTAIYEMVGKYGPDDNPVTDTAVWDDYFTGGKTRVRMVTTFIDENTHKIEMYMTGPDGKEFKSMDAVYTKKP